MATNYDICPSRVQILRQLSSMETFMVRIYTGSLSQETEFVSVEAEKGTPACDVVKVAVRKLKLGNNPHNYELAEVFSSGGQLCKERRLDPMDNPVRVQLLWPKVINAEIDRGQGLYTGYRFYIRKADPETQKVSGWVECKDASVVDSFLSSFLKQPTSNKEYTDLCNLPDLNEKTLLENIKARFENANIYTYVGSILIAVNPFKFFPIYNPKYVKMYQNKWLGELPPHIFAIADAAYSTMLRTKQNQCIVISGESGSGKTESTNLLLHHLTALSHKGLHGSGVEQTILGAGPVLEAFGNAKTVHNNNSSRFGKFIQVNYKENGMVHGAIVEKYLLEKSRIVSQAKNERNYHVFYYLLAGADKNERESLYLSEPEEYYYLSQSDCYSVEGVDEEDEFARLKQSMEMVGFSHETQKRIFAVLSAVLHLGNIEFRKKGDQHHDESVSVKNEATVQIICSLLKVKEKTVLEALTTKKTVAGDETVVINYKMEDAIATRDAMAKCLYGSLFDWIVLKVNQALLAKKHNSEHQVPKEVVLSTSDSSPESNGHLQGQLDLESDPLALGNSIGVLDIFGFEDFGKNSFEQFCINFANEHLQYYFNQHIFKFEQEEYQREGIQWKNIEFIDNTACLELFSKRPKGLFCLMDEECNFPGATNDTMLSKFTHQHTNNPYYQVPQLKERAFVIVHYAGKVKYSIKDFREKNADLIRTDIVGVLKKSSQSFVRELVGIDPVAVLRWSIVRAFFRCYHAFFRAGERYRKNGEGRCFLFPGPEKKKLKKRLSDSQLETSIGENLLRLCGLSRNELMEGSIVKKKGEEGHPPDEQRSQSSPHDSQSNACPSTVDECFSDDDSVFIRQHGDFLHEEKILASHMSAADTRVIRKATKIIMKSRSFKPKPRPSLSFRDIKTLKAIASRTMISFGGSRVGSKKQPPTVGAQFQWSLSRLMHTLNKANPFFIRCIKSNADKAPCVFDDEIVLRQLRYTGMLATVKIRQSGYNYRLTFEEFIQLYKILLPKGLLSSQEDVKIFLESMDLNRDNYQIGKTKVFLRESEKLMLDEALHRAIMERVIKIQRWAKTILERQNYSKLRTAVVLAQKCTRRWLAQRTLSSLRLEYDAALAIQRWYRGNHVRRWYLEHRKNVICIQTSVRGFLARKRHHQMLVNRDIKRKAEEEQVRQKLEDLQSSTSDEGVLLKGSSAEELLERECEALHRRDSEESSGILEDSESETTSEPKSRVVSGTSPPITPTSSGSGSVFITRDLGENKDDSWEHTRSPGRVQELAKAFQSQPSTPSKDENDGRKYFIRRGSQRWKPKEQSPAPLAKQESFSDMELSPTQPSDTLTTAFPLSPDKIQAIEHVVSKHKDRHDQQQVEGDRLQPDVAGGPPHLSPFHRVKKGFKNMMGGKKKERGHTDSDEEPEEVGSPSSKTSPSKRPQDLGVSVLPPHPTPAPMSPRSPVKERNERDFQIVSQHGWQREKRKKKRRQQGQVQSRGNWKVEGTSQWQYPAELVITDLQELMFLDEFIGKKHEEVFKNEGKRATIFDKIFQGAIEEFRKNLKAIVGTESQKDTVSVRYRDLLSNFEQSLSAEVKHERTNATFPVTMGINAFRGFLDEFIKNHAGKKREEKKKEEKKVENKNAKKDKQRKDAVEHLGHKFLQVQFNIPTFCELCSSLIWIMEKGQVCQVCKYTCHKKCSTKTMPTCRGALDTQGKVTSQTFGAGLESLVSDGLKVPKVAERLIQTIELNGMFTEGLYRKSGAAPKVRHLRQIIEADIDAVDFEEYPVHVLTSTLKCFFRELPEPLLTFDLYEDFIRAAEIKDEKERIQSLFTVIERLPKANYDLCERLMFHLARVAMHEGSNKMSCNGLAIIFAPCLLRSNKVMQAQESLNQVPRQTQCIEFILGEQLMKVNATLEDIHTLESAERSASDRLSFVRASIRAPKSRPVSIHKPISPIPVKEEEEEEETLLIEEARVLSAHIASIHKEKDNLTTRLPVLEPRQASSDEDMLTGDEFESSFDPMDDLDDNEEYASTFDLPVSPPSLLHLTKRRTIQPFKKPPSRYSVAIKKARLRYQSCGSLPDDELDDVPVPTITVQRTDVSGSFVDHMVIESSFVSIPDFKNIAEEDEIMV
ncbi:unconventional myosin-IXb-like isoform X6 [Haliotis cracherodii]|uniref:unconventional myosin-IXb-like isoform X6 n=1 Tax=Haliotis cracherodii TaxID=6455 RepID=UPI0039ECA3DF